MVSEEKIEEEGVIAIAISWVPFYGIMVRGFPQISLLSLGIFFKILLTGDRSYQYLKDATSFGLLSNKSAE